MFLLDTNVISELRKIKTKQANKNVKKWASNVSTASLFLSVITILELETGVLLIERRDKPQGLMLRTWFEGQVLPAFSGRILAIDTAIARRCASLHIPDPKSDRDALIAATAIVHGMAVVTRNIVDYENTGVDVLNPWDINS